MDTASPDTLRSIVMLIASVVALVAAVLSLLSARLKEAPSEDAKRGVYRSAMGWVETGLWAVAPLTFMLPYSASWALCAWIPAYVLAVHQFLSSKDSSRLRAEIFKLVFTAQAIVLLISVAVAQHFASLLERVIDVLVGK